ncbi:LOC108666550-like protein [Homarus gammarus nudivirus]|uniref:LOC108666550-like protein n=1 Tax=Homarus gammarus nudivirus TaxID=2509616 RepID=A0A411HBB2_9VIRU|nr:LOC108666550-like protein [Homarus gammarus nudivirus]QBB28676.1 LOC108666550-like protein [Homarus gammarus nudivirus]
MDPLSSSLVKSTTRKIPEGILPSNYEGSLVDISVKCKGPDDIVYKQNRLLWEKIPRGYTRLELNGGNSEVVIYANHKFDYQMHHPIGDDETYDRIVAVEKMNGEAAHFSGRYIGDEFYFIAGSKKTHIIFQNEDHIKLYNDDVNVYARTIATALLDKFNSMPSYKQEDLKGFLSTTKVTAVMEILLPDNQHIVQLEEGPNELVGLFFTKQPPLSDITTLLAYPFEAGMEVFEDFEFTVPNFEYVDYIEDHRQEVRSRKYTEGVVYFLQNTAEDTIGVIKQKSKWYAHIRALRQQAQYALRVKPPIEWAKEQSRNRMETLQGYTYTTDMELSEWMDISDKWIEYATKNIQHKDEVSCNFPSTWNKFIEECNILHDYDVC